SIQDALGSQIAIRQDRGRTVQRDDLLPARRDFVQSRLPADAGELPRAFRAAALERIENAIGVVHSLLVMVHLDAQPSIGERVVGVAAHAHHAIAFDRHEHRAGVGTIMRTGGQDGLASGRRTRNGRHAISSWFRFRVFWAAAVLVFWFMMHWSTCPAVERDSHIYPALTFHCATTRVLGIMSASHPDRSSRRRPRPIDLLA